MLKLSTLGSKIYYEPSLACCSKVYESLRTCNMQNMEYVHLGKKNTDAGESKRASNILTNQIIQTG